ncbi:glutamate--tRNA ligase [Acaryochloris sp. IP29b_bin.137]|uniref:glutamate--tRNA ligase n=1 Tax=Acaryochloris sp. IP29b_bin.137 TaxID=2969217 RepID=UPI0026271E6A|nr:glutamate--tRNA ligase [Acaryochloris sp. IP29b_bin.137]
MTVRVRIAPSPTGNLHIGTARTAVFNWLYARHHQGTFILRVEDTDQARSQPEYTENILEGLRWLGMAWDEGPYFQSQRLDLYRDAIQKLLDQGLAYRCYCTPDELDAMRAAQKERNEAPRYDNRHRHLTAAQEATFQAEGRQPVIRFKIDDNQTIAWKDLVRGPMHWQGRDLGGDMVVARATASGEVGQPLYNLAVVVDDMDLNISHVIRGEDHIANTAKQILLYQALGGAVPEFAHTPLILNKEGRKLSKRDGVTSISDFQEMGFTAPALANYMTLLGWSPPDPTQEIFSLRDAAAQFDFERVNKAGAKFDWDKLDWLSSQYLHDQPVVELADALIPYWQGAGYDFDLDADRPWLDQVTALIQPSLVRLKDAVEMTQFLFTRELTWTEDACKQLSQEGVAVALQGVIDPLADVEGSELSAEAAKSFINSTVKANKLKKGLVMRSLRAALTGDMKGPDLMESWLLLHQRGEDLKRLQQALEIAGA